MKLQKIALSLISIAFAMMVGCGGNNNARPAGELSRQLTSQESLQIQRDNVQRVTQNRTRPQASAQPSLPTYPGNSGSGYGASYGSGGCAGGASATTYPAASPSTSGYAGSSGSSYWRDPIHPEESNRYLLDSRTPQELSISFTQNHFSISIEDEVVLEGSWREINSHTLEISFDGYTLHVDVALDGDQLDFEEIPSAGPVLNPCFDQPSYPAADTRNAGQYPVPSPSVVDVVEPIYTHE